MGKAVKTQGNPELAKPHVAGATVTVFQLLRHAQLGAIAYQWPRMFLFEWGLAAECHEQLIEQHATVVSAPVDSSRMRSISDLEFLASLYDSGSGMVSHSVRAVQQLALEMQRSGPPLTETSVGDRIKEAARALGIDDRSKSPEFQGFIEMVAIRDAIEHPKEENVHQGDENRWDEVPLAWMLSERSLQAFERFDRWFEQVVADWNSYGRARARPTTLQVAKRGVESALQFKKPPKSEGE